MKKTLHGKRYLRSRASVMIGRERRANKKAERLIYYFNSVDWNEIANNLTASLYKMINSAKSVRDIFIEFFDKYHTVEQEPDGTYIHYWNFPL